MRRLEGKVALISGASRGQGAAEAVMFAEEGAKVVLGDVLDDLGKDLAAQIGSAAVYQHLDVTSEDDWAAAVDMAVSQFGKLDVLINNAGIVRSAPLEDTTLDDYMAVVQVNQVGCFLGMRAAIPALKAAGGGSIVNVSSNAGMEGVPGIVAYVASKWAMRGMTKTAALELGRYGIRVNSVHPGGVDTPMLGQEDFDTLDKNAIFGAQPVPRIGQPDEIARMMVFLASDESSFSTGSEFIADGGLMAGNTGHGAPSPEE